MGKVYAVTQVIIYIYRRVFGRREMSKLSMLNLWRKKRDVQIFYAGFVARERETDAVHGPNGESLLGSQIILESGMLVNSNLDLTVSFA